MCVCVCGGGGIYGKKNIEIGMYILSGNSMFLYIMFSFVLSHYNTF